MLIGLSFKMLVVAPLFSTACDFKSVKGLEFAFAEVPAHYVEIAASYWREAPSESFPTSLRSRVGLRGKILDEERTGPDGLTKYTKVLLENCSVLYLTLQIGTIKNEHAELIGVEFSGGGVDSKWMHYVQTDEMTDEKRCIVTVMGGEDMNPSFYYFPDKTVEATLLGADFPGRPVQFRVDKSRAISQDDGLGNAATQQLVKAIRAGGERLRVSGVKWPNDYEVVREFNLDGVIAELDACKAAMEQ